MKLETTLTILYLPFEISDQPLSDGLSVRQKYSNIFSIVRDNFSPDDVKTLSDKSLTWEKCEKVFSDVKNYVSPGGVKTLFDKSLIWEKCTKFSIAKDYLYPYVWQFMSGSIDFAENVQIYELKNGACCSFNNNNTYTIAFTKQKKQYEYRFKFCSGKKMDAPHLLIYPHCPIGILMLGVELQGKDLTTGDLKMFNYYIHRIGRDPVCLLPNRKDIAKKLYGATEKLNEAKKSYEDTKDLNAAKKLYEAKDLNDANQKSDSEEVKGITLMDLCELLLADVVIPKKIDFLETTRMQVFSYMQVSDVENMDEFRSDLMQIAGVQTDAYQRSDSMSQPVALFQNIHVCSRNEGGVMATILTPECDTTFFKEYKSNKFVAEYLWMHTIALMQYNALISLSNRLYMPLSKRDISKTIDRLWLIKKHTYIYVSRFTHINLFYKTIIDNMGLHSLLAMLDENYNNMQSGEQMKNSSRTNWILGFLTVSQVVFAILTFFSVSYTWKPIILIILGILWCIGCVCIVGWYILPVTYVYSQVRNKIIKRKSEK